MRSGFPLVGMSTPRRRQRMRHQIRTLVVKLLEVALVLTVVVPTNLLMRLTALTIMAVILVLQFGFLKLLPFEPLFMPLASLCLVQPCLLMGRLLLVELLAPSCPRLARSVTRTSCQKRCALLIKRGCILQLRGRDSWPSAFWLWSSSSPRVRSAMGIRPWSHDALGTSHGVVTAGPR